jgi:hypothetical protein
MDTGNLVPNKKVCGEMATATRLGDDTDRILKLTCADFAGAEDRASS